ncbi:site-specific DNA-methyltransferase [Gemella morbillorum]|uniref:site-specific DNA-methyltransferase n=1 Tax=Gemella morbillorum TaxID=29391 RepID=UPI00319DD002
MGWKKTSIIEANRPIRKTLRPIKEKSVDWNTTKNLYIEGDNFEVLKTLQESYLHKVKMIYIDPPYNTGRNYIYRNDFSIGSGEYDVQAGLVTEEGARLASNPVGSARFHSTWLSMMYQRLLLARNLLTDDGVLVLAIDENELYSIGMILKEVFGEGTYDHVCISVVHNPRGQQGKNFSYTNEYAIFVFPRDMKVISDRRINEEDVSWSTLRNWGSESERTDAKNCFYPVIVKNDRIIGFGDVAPDDYHPSQTVKKGDTYYVYPIDRQGIERKWRYARQTVESIWSMLRPKKIEGGYDIELGKTFGAQKTIWDEKKYDANEYGSKLVSELIPGGGFSFPKSLHTVFDTVYAATATDKDAIVMDFFSGSATTAHAVMKLNAEDGGNRTFIMVQLPEDLHEAASRTGLDARLKANIKATIKYIDEQGYEPTICSIGEERIRKAGKKLKEEYPDSEQLDVGFRVLKLDDSNMKDVYYTSSEITQDFLTSLESNIKEDRTDLDLLFGCLLEWGLPLSLPYKSFEIDGRVVHDYNNGDLVACFEESISENVMKEMAKLTPLRVVFRDSSFENSAEKINTNEIFKLLSPDTKIKVI